MTIFFSEDIPKIRISFPLLKLFFDGGGFSETELRIKVSLGIPFWMKGQTPRRNCYFEKGIISCVLAVSDFLMIFLNIANDIHEYPLKIT